MLILTAIALFVIAACFGLVILTAILKDQPTPKLFVAMHGPIAASALVLLIIDIVKGHTEGLLIASVIIFVLAAMGGFYLYTMDMLKKPIPKIAALLHPLTAATGLVVLIIYALS